MPSQKTPAPTSIHAAIPDYLIVWRNPGSTNNHRTDQIIANFTKAELFKDIIVIETVHKKPQQNQRRLAEELAKVQGKAWVAIAGGDGTISAVINALYQKQNPDMWPSLLPLPAGNSNDIATMLHTKKALTATRLQHASHLPIYALECTLTDGQGNKNVRYAVAYIGFGITARTAQMINAPLHRNQHTARTSHRIYRRLHEIRRFTGVVQRAVPFTVQELGQPKILFERIITNGQRMAKYFRWPVKLPEEAFHDISVNKLGLTYALKNIVLMTRGKVSGQRKTKNAAVEFTCVTSVLAQFDGETVEIAAGTTISIRHSVRPLDFIAAD